MPLLHSQLLHFFQLKVITYFLGSSRVNTDIYSRPFLHCILAEYALACSANFRASFLNSHEQANQCNNFGEKEEVYFFLVPLIYEKWILEYKFNITNSKLVVLYSNCSQIIFSPTLQKLSLHLYLRSPESDRT